MSFRARAVSILLLTPFLIAVSPGASSAGRCGDAVDGERVPCACGDVVVSDTRLLPSDPVVSGRCPDDGLILRAGEGVESLVLDLDGNGLTGRGSGAGILILDGGSEGAILIGGRDGDPGQVAGFRVGVSARGSDDLLAMENLIVLGNETDGIRVSGRGAVLSGVVADDNGGHGLRARGRDHALAGVAASGNGRQDVRVSGNGHYVESEPRAAAEGTVRVTGAGNVVTPEVAR